MNSYCYILWSHDPILIARQPHLLHHFLYKENWRHITISLGHREQYCGSTTSSNYSTRMVESFTTGCIRMALLFYRKIPANQKALLLQITSISPRVNIMGPIKCQQHCGAVSSQEHPLAFCQNLLHQQPTASQHVGLLSSIYWPICRYIPFSYVKI